jgi:hypothetical protein
MNKYTKLKEVIKNIVREEMLGEITQQVTVDYSDPNKGDKILNVDPADKATIDTIKRDSTVKAATIGKTKIKELAAPTTTTYALKIDYEDRLKDYLLRIKKDPIKNIINKMIDRLKVEDNMNIGDIFTQLRADFANDPAALLNLKQTQNVKYYLWGGMTSDTFNQRYLSQIDPQTDQPWEQGNLNAVSWTPFVRSKDKRLTGFEKAQQQAITDPEAFAAKQASFKETNTVSEKVLKYKFLRADYFTKSSQNRADVKIDKTLKGTQGGSTSAEKMSNMLDDNLAVALLYQWKEGYLEAGLDEPLKLYTNKNDLLKGKNPEGLTNKYSEILLKLINNKDIKVIGKNDFSPKKKNKSAVSQDDIEAYYKSTGIETPDTEKIDLTNTDLAGEDDEEEI